jgi:phenylalanyl-tRNA synthetase alpha chain
MQSIQELVERALAHINQADSLPALDQARVQYLGKSGELTAQMKSLGGLPPEERKPFGQAVNAAKSRIEEAIDQRNAMLQETAKPAGPDLDVTLPGRRRWAGRVHPITATAEAMKKILMGLGFSYDDYPDIESEYYNFDALNTPAWHPARDLHDTFYVGQGQLLRTHTTAFQGRVMRTSGGRVPIRGCQFAR